MFQSRANAFADPRGRVRSPEEHPALPHPGDARQLLQEWLELADSAHAALDAEDPDRLLAALEARDALMPRIESAVRRGGAAAAGAGSLEELIAAVAHTDRHLLERMGQSRDQIAAELDGGEQVEIVTSGYDVGGRPGASAIDFVR